MNIEGWLSFFRWILYGGTALVAIGTIAVSILSSQIDKKKDKKIDELVEGKNQLISQNKELNSNLEKYQKDLNEKNKQIKQLEIEAKKAQRGITSIYDFQGVKRETRGPGQTIAVVGAEVSIFQSMVKLEQERKYQELVTICKKQIKDTPEWLTSYLFLGIAYANLGQKAEAIEQFEYVLKNAPDDPSYKQAADFLKKLQEETSK